MVIAKLVFLCLCTAVTASEYFEFNMNKTETKTFKCIMCSDTFSGTGPCAAKPTEPSPDVGEVNCDKFCYVKVVKVFGKISRIDRGCTDDCKPSYGCGSWAICKTCCQGGHLCNDDTGF
ncbi:uncharacterized protein LOC144443761 [Glandiceps talaboti]